MEVSQDVLDKLPHDRKSCNLFVEYYGQRVVSFLRTLYWTVDRDVSIEELKPMANEVLCEGIVHIRTYRSSDGPVSSWLMGIAANKFKNNQRYWSAGRRNRQAISNVDPDTTTAEARDPDTAIVKQEVESVLDDHEKKLLAMRCEGIPFKTIAKLLGVNETALRRQYTRLIEKMRKRYGVNIKKGGESQ